MNITHYLALASGILSCTLPTKAQEAIDYENIFSLRHNDIAIPKGNKLYTYSLRQNVWTITDTIGLPPDYIGLDGNIRRVYMLQEDKMVFHGFYGERNDTLYFNDSIPMPSPSHWIRTPRSTEKDFYVYKDEKNIAFIKDGEEWQVLSQLSPLYQGNHTKPTLPQSAPFRKLYSCNIGGGPGLYIAAVFEDEISFYQFEINEEYEDLVAAELMTEGLTLPTPQELEFQLPQQAKSTFIFDASFIAVVYENHITFHHYDFGGKKWIDSSRIPHLAYNK